MWHIHAFYTKNVEEICSFVVKDGWINEDKERNKMTKLINLLL